MKRLDKLLPTSIVLIIIGFLWAITMNGIGMIEWVLLLSGVILGIFAGLIQGWSITRKKHEKIGSGRMILWVIGAIVVLIIIKVTLNIMIPPYLSTSSNGISLSIIFAIGGLLLGRFVYSRILAALD